MGARNSKYREMSTALAFLTPNLCGVLIFTVFPVMFSIVMALTNWDVRLHNMFKDQPLRFVGLDNFIRLITEADFPRFLGNTLFLMMGIPFSVAGSLCAALMLSRSTHVTGRRRWLVVSGLVLGVGAALLAAGGMGATGMTMLVLGVVGVVLIGGITGGTTVYRTLFYAPHFTAGVATYLLWKKLYNPVSGPINAALRPVLDALSSLVAAAPGVVIAVRWTCFLVMVLLCAAGLSWLRRTWRDGDTGTRAAVLPVLLLLLPSAAATVWPHSRGVGPWLALVIAAVLLWQTVSALRHGRQFKSRPNEGLGTALMFALVLMVGQFILLGVGAVCGHLPAMVSDPAAPGLEPPNWLTDYHWAKPSLMIMGFWAAIGSNNMLLYLAALTNVSPELYEAADIDGAKRFQRFWHVTWPQLAPTTFFIAVMATIHGLQGGFEMARTMTLGGPDGATTTLSYFIYVEGFQNGRMGFAAAVAWALFLLVFLLTIFNWRFGNRYVDE